jgi:predicted ATPase
MPASIRDVVGRRLSRLSETCNQALAVASVLGREFNLPLLARVSGQATDPLLDALEEAARAQLIEEDLPATRYRFSHALVQETLYAELSTGRRVRLHRQAGEALEALHAHDLVPQLAALARHFFQSASFGTADKAVDYALRAAERAESQAAWESAGEHYERALQALELQPESSVRQRCELLLTIGELHMRAHSATGNCSCGPRSSRSLRPIRSILPR